MPFLKMLGALGALLATAGLTAPAYAQTLAELEAYLSAHPSLTALTFQAEANQERSLAATALPDPVVSVGINNFPIFDPSFSDFLPTNKAVGVRQEFPNLAGRKARAGESRARADQSLVIRQAQYATLRGELIAMLHKQTRIAHQRRFAEARDTKYDELSEVVESEIDAGRPVVFRLAEIESERAGVAREIVDLDLETAELNARLIDLIGLVPDTPPPSVIPLEWTGSVTKFHAVRVADAGIEVTDYSVDEAKSAWRPNWGAQLTYQQRESGATFPGDDWVSGMVTFSVPLWAERKQAPRLRAAQADKASAQMRYHSAARGAVARYTAQAAAWKAAENRIAVLERNIRAVEDEIATQLIGYESGAGDYAPIIDGEIAILKLRADISAEKARRAAAIARLNALLVTS
jgi:cobalt-zinc-cadmium efflux system outer membrane protein